MAAKIVMIVDDENFGVCTNGFAVEIGCGKPADPAADNHQVVMLARIRRIFWFNSIA